MSRITDREQIISMIQSVPFWYHQIEFFPGVITPGKNESFKVLENLNKLGLPKDAQGLRVLDIGCRDGFFAFEMERRGAEVIGVDYALPSTTGFNVAAKILDSKVAYIVENVYDLAPDKYGVFDIVLFLGVIYHLRNPLLALDAIRSVIKPGGLLFVESAVVTEQVIANANIPLWRFYPGNSFNNDATNKWAPNMPGLEAAIEEAGFQAQQSLKIPSRGYVVAQAIFDSQQNHFQKLDSSKGIFGRKKSTEQYMEDSLDLPIRSLLPMMQKRIEKNTTYFGVRAMKSPLDYWVYQEIVHEQKPDFIIEIGNRFGGSTLALAHLCDLVGHGRLIGLDIAHGDIHPTVLEHPRITLIEGDACSSFEKVRSLIPLGANVLVIEDSAHTFENTLNVLNTYGVFILKGGYMIVEDGICHHGLDIGPNPGPYEAIDVFLRQNSRFEIDREREAFFISWNPKGYLRCIASATE